MDAALAEGRPGPDGARHPRPGRRARVLGHARHAGRGAARPRRRPPARRRDRRRRGRPPLRRRDGRSAAPRAEPRPRRRREGEPANPTSALGIPPRRARVEAQAAEPSPAYRVQTPRTYSARRQRPLSKSQMPAHDVLIIGAGLAGQRAALAAAQRGATVAIMSKVHPVRSHSVAAAGRHQRRAQPRRTTGDSHAYDTVKGSDFLGDQDAIEIMCREAPERDPAPRAHRASPSTATRRASSTCAPSAAPR